MNNLQILKLMEEKCEACGSNHVCEGEYQFRCVSEDFVYYNKKEEQTIDKLESIMKIQKQLQEKTMGYKFDTMTPQDRAKYIKDMMFWTNDELSELTHELPYAKDWSKKYDKPEYNHKKQWRLVKEEYIDALHFFINVAIAIGFTPEEIYTMYLEKNKENIDRQKRGY